MVKTNQITPGRQQMLLYLAQRNDWVYITKVFEDTKPEGIDSLHGARKALKELDYVEKKDVTPGMRPTYQCRLKQDTDTFATLLNMFVGTKDQKEFLASAYCKQMTQDWSPHCLAQAPPAQMSDSMRSVFDADEKEFPDASEPSFPIDAEIVSLAVPPDDLHRIVGEMIVEHATYLAQLIHRFYPKLQLNAELIGFLYEVERARQTGVATCTETT